MPGGSREYRKKPLFGEGLCRWFLEVSFVKVYFFVGCVLLGMVLAGGCHVDALCGKGEEAKFGDGAGNLSLECPIIVTDPVNKKSQ